MLRVATMMVSLLARDLVEPITATLQCLHPAARQLSASPENAESLALIEAAIKQTIEAMEVISRVPAFGPAGHSEGRPESLLLMIDKARADLILQNRIDTEVTIQIDPDAGDVVVDRASIELVITILLDEITASLPRGASRRMKVEGRRRGDMVELRIGSPPATFRQALSALLLPTRGAKGGFEADLALCRSLVEANGGQLRAGRSGRRGVELILTLPGARQFAPRMAALPQGSPPE